LDTTAFRLGTIVRTATLMDEDDLEYVDNNDYFLYGFFPHDSIKRGQEAEYFKNDSIFKKLCNQKDSTLVKRYDKKHLSNLSYLSNLSNLSNLSYLSYLSDLPYLSNLSNLPNRSYLSDLSDYGRFVKDNDAYQIYYKTHVFPKLDTTRLSGYGLDFSFKKYKYKNLIFDIPQYFYPLEDGIRSIRHAQQYLNKRIIYRYFKLGLQYLPFALLLFFIVSFLSKRRNLLAASVVVLMVFFLSNYFYPENLGVELEIGSYLMASLAILSLIISLFFSIFLNYENSGIINFLINLFVVAVISIAFLIPIFTQGEDISFYYTKTGIFYLTVILCLIAPILFSYLKGLPKSR